jgi:hypothetical protein
VSGGKEETEETGTEQNMESLLTPASLSPSLPPSLFPSLTFMRAVKVS